MVYINKECISYIGIKEKNAGTGRRAPIPAFMNYSRLKGLSDEGTSTPHKEHAEHYAEGKIKHECAPVAF